MTYKIIDIEGIGKAYAPKLTKAGIVTVAALLKKCATPKGRAALAEATGISEKLILTWTNHADLFRVKGVGPQFAELLEAAGVDTVKELLGFLHIMHKWLRPRRPAKCFRIPRECRGKARS